jgi:hypothetical protein
MDRRFSLFFPAAFIAVLGWLGYWLTKTRYALLDDALIHLHYADLLHRDHYITFDGIHHSFGTSSLLYVGLLAFLRGFFTGPLLPKAVSDLSYLALVFTVFWLIFRMRQKPVSQLLLAEMLVCLLSPTGIRWLTGGMETSLTNLFVVALWSSSRSK